MALNIHFGQNALNGESGVGYLWLEQPVSGEPNYPKVNSIPISFRIVTRPALNPLTMNIYFDSTPAMLGGAPQTGFIGYYELLDPVSGEYLFALKACNISVDWNQTIWIAGNFEDCYGEPASFEWPVTIITPPDDILSAVPGGLSANLDLLSGKTVLYGSTRMQVSDLDGVFTRFLRENSELDEEDNLAIKTPLNDFVEIYQGFEGQSESEFQCIAAGWVKDIVQKDGVTYELTIYDFQKLLDKDIFQFTGSYLTQSPYNYKGCLRFVQNQYWSGYFKYGDVEFRYEASDVNQIFPIPVAPTGKTPFNATTKAEISPEDVYGATYSSKSFREFYIGIGYDNAQTSTLKVDDNTPTDHDETDDTATYGYNPIDLILSILLSTNPTDPRFPTPNNDKSRTGLDDPGYDWRTSGMGLSIPIELIDVEEFIRIRNNYFKNIYELSFQIKEKVNAKEFIEEQICKVYGLNLVMDGNKLSLIVNEPPGQLQYVTPVAAFSDGSDENGTIQTTLDANIIKIPELTIQSKDCVNVVRFKYDYQLPGAEDDWFNEYISTDVDSIDMYNETKEFTIESQGIKTAKAGYGRAFRRAEDIRLRYRDPLPVYNVVTNMTLLYVTYGDPVTLTASALIDFYTASGKASRGLYQQLCRVLDKKIDWKAGTITWKLLDEKYSKYQDCLVAPDSLADYNSASTYEKRTYMFMLDPADNTDGIKHPFYLKDKY